MLHSSALALLLGVLSSLTAVPTSAGGGDGRLLRREGVAIGHRQLWELGETGPDGRTSVNVRTLSLQPLIFEVEEFLSEAEADHIVALATDEGLGDSYTLASSATKDRFRLNDYNKDGVLDVQELILMIDGLVDAHVSAADVELMIEQLRMDPDGDGRVAKHHLAAPELWMQYLTQLLKDSPTKRSRDSEQVWLYPRQLAGGPDPVLTALQSRVAALTQLPAYVVENSDSLQVVRYGTGGHYTTHYDSADVNPERTCCHLTRPFRTTTREQLQHQSCRLCRFATVLYSLNGAESNAGGETAFPLVPNTTLAALPTVAEQRAEIIGWRHSPASREGSYCTAEGGTAVLRARPAKGSALLWYNHEVDEQSGALGENDPLSMHAGCPLRKAAGSCFGCEPGEEQDDADGEDGESGGGGGSGGSKWIANHWIEAAENLEVRRETASSLSFFSRFP
jgi:hypoxia-inducible factor prolyl 4-hydroxylase